MTFGQYIDNEDALYYLDIALTVIVMAQVVLYIGGLSDELNFISDSVPAKVLSPLLLTLLLCVVIAKHVVRAQRSQRTQASRIQLNAMVSLSAIIRHRLNNDMQVVLGNAELAQILINNEGNLMKPLQNIAEAADNAIERIEALAVVGCTDNGEYDSIDLNAVLRKSMARLVSAIPSTVTIRLDLEPLPSRVIADRSLLSLSLAHLVTQASDILRSGVDVVIKSADIPANDTDRQSRVSVELCLMYARIQSINAQDIIALEDSMLTTKFLVERSLAENVRLSFSNHGCCVSFNFTKDINNPETRRRSTDQSIKPFDVSTT